MRHPLALLGLLAVSLLPLPGQASDDHDRARAALLAGEILPLPVVLERVARAHPGHVLEVELERAQQRWIYEFKLLQSGGGLIRLEVDAKDASVIKRREGAR